MAEFEELTELPITQGETLAFDEIAILDDNDQPIDVTGCMLKWIIRNTKTGAVVLDLGEYATSAGGKFVVSIPKSVTDPIDFSDCWHDMAMIDPSGTIETPLATGPVSFARSVIYG